VVGEGGGASPDLVLHGGDLVLMGPRPAQVADLMRELGWPGVLGNTDEVLWRPEIRLELEQPRGRLHERGERGREEEVLAANRQSMSRRDRLRQLRVEQLVVEHGRRGVSARLQEVVGRGRDEDQRQGERPREHAGKRNGLGRSLSRRRGYGAHRVCIGSRPWRR